MLRENCKEFIRKLEQNQDNGLNTLKVNLDASGWYDMHDENADLSEALYKYLKQALSHIFVQDFEISQSYVDDLLDE